MRGLKRAFLVTGLLLVAGLTGCGRPGAGLKPGDTITPFLDQPITWRAGGPALISVRLRAVAEDGAAARFLGFESVPSDVNPVARVTFYEGEETLNTAEVKLTHRC